MWNKLVFAIQILGRFLPNSKFAAAVCPRVEHSHPSFWNWFCGGMWGCTNPGQQQAVTLLVW